MNKPSSMKDLLRNIDKRFVVLLVIAMIFIGLSFIVSEVDHIVDNSGKASYELGDFTSGPAEKKASENKKVPKNKNAVIHKTDKDEYRIVNGDTLTSIRQRFLLSDKLFYALLDADSDTLGLDNIKPGQKLIVVRKEGQVDSIILQFNPAKKIVYTRTGPNAFQAEWVNITGIWKDTIIEGQVKNTFSGSAEKAGLTPGEATFITQLLKNKVDFRRDFRAGNPFKILLSRQYVDGELTGQSEVLAVELQVNNKSIQTFLYKGHYYDQKGQSIEQSFNTYPFKGHYRISSAFNLHRKHPVTGAIKPHYGTDFATPVGTTITSTGDGVVTRVVRHKYAGLYIEIDHGSQYQTRYLHLKKALVKKGQHVTRGMPIALSGASGRVTGPHLHYEFHANGRAINPAKASRSKSYHLDKKDKALFARKVEAFQHLLAGEGLGCLGLHDKTDYSGLIQCVIKTG